MARGSVAQGSKPRPGTEGAALGRASTKQNVLSRKPGTGHRGKGMAALSPEPGTIHHPGGLHRFQVQEVEDCAWGPHPASA